jgi:hypothetical protein
LDAIPSLVTALDRALATLDEPALIGHPASQVLIRRRAGRLSDRYLGCSTPAQVLALGAQLGVSLPEPPLV